MLASRSAYFSAWRRCTRPLTAVAVPAMAAVRATPRSNPGMSCSPLSRSSGSVEGVERVEHVLRGDPGRGHDIAAGTAHGGHERSGPRVLVHDERAHLAGLEGVTGVGQILVAQEAG